MPAAPPRPSLLSPRPASPAARTALNAHDLGLPAIIQALDFDRRHQQFFAQTLDELVTDGAVIAFRQDMLANLLELPSLANAFEALLPSLRELNEKRLFLNQQTLTPLVMVGGRLADLDNYLQCVEGLWQALEDEGSAAWADGLQAFHSYLAALRADADYQRLAAELPQLRAQLDQASSVTLGINLSADLQPESATIVSVNATRFGSKGTLLDRLFGERAARETLRGITALYKAQEGVTATPEHDLFRDLHRLLDQVAAPVAAALEQYKRLFVTHLAAFEPELAFYIGAVKLTTQLRAAGLSLCRPTIAPLDERLCIIDGVYSLDLTLRLRQSQDAAAASALVLNDVQLDPAHAINLLTGPNSGGKTTYIRAIGQAQVLFQAGLLVPGQRARISPVDHILTHFATGERLDRDGGRLDEELERLAQVFAHATPHSLVLLNEPLTSTNHQAASRIAHDIVQGLSMLGARAIFVTHLIELYDQLVSQSGGTPAIVSLVAGSVRADGAASEHATPTYTIRPGPPRLANHAHDLALRYGLSRDQIAQTLRARGVVPPDAAAQPPQPAYTSAGDAVAHEAPERVIHDPARRQENRG